MPLFQRCDGELVRDLDPTRLIMTLLMRKRNDSVNYHTTQWDISKTRVWLREFNLRRGARAPATLFHLVIYGCVRTLYARPGMNRVVSGGRIYQRNAVSVTFVAKARFADDAPGTTIKLAFQDNIHFDECVDRVTESVLEGRSGRPNAIQREVRSLTRLPSCLLRTALAAGRVLDRLNLLPASLIDPDPMYTSVFLANLGSFGMDNAFHYLYEHGTCSVFGVMGKAGKSLVLNESDQPEVRETLEMQWSFDGRVNEGLYSFKSLEMLKSILEDPQLYVECDEAQAPTSSDASLHPDLSPA